MMVIDKELDAKLKAAARRFGPDAEDAYQDMVLVILEGRTKPDDTPAFASWKARLHVMRAWGLDGQKRQAAFERRVVPLAYANEDGEIIEFDAADPLAVAELDAVDLAEIIAALPENLRNLAILLAEGLTMAQAADELGISRQLANYRRKLLLKHLAPVYGLAA